MIVEVGDGREEYEADAPCLVLAEAGALLDGIEQLSALDHLRHQVDLLRLLVEDVQQVQDVRCWASAASVVLG